MKPLMRRLLVLERVCQVETYVEREDSPAAIIRARRLRRLQAEGACIPPESPRKSHPRGATIADILRQGRRERRCPQETAT
jgi:hypothetical protein